MTVFYNVRQHFATLRSSLISALRSSTRAGKGSKDGSRGFHEIQSPGMQHLPLGGSGPVTANAGLDRRTSRETDFPMHSIAVRREMQWSERSPSQTRNGDDVV